jgi:pyruvate formate lyase activating enzyme
MKQPLIADIGANSLDDGPGIRSVIFFKGCPLSCIWCHNPESRRVDAEIAFDAKLCVGCDTCIGSCTVDALCRDHPFFVDRTRCNLCFACAQACPSGALSRLGRPMSPEQIVTEVLRDQPFFETSGGGVTFSGGEPTRFMEFCGQLARALKSHKIHILLETCGLFDYLKFEALVYPFLDAIYFDIKLLDAEAHTRYCGVPNGPVLANFRRLHERFHQGGVPIIARTPLIPGITDTVDNLHAIAEFLTTCGAAEARLLPYHPLWQEKSRTIGIETQNDHPAFRNWLDKRNIEACRSIFLQAGIHL